MLSNVSFQLFLRMSATFLSNWFWGRHAMCPSNFSWGCQAMFPSNCSWGCHATCPFNCSWRRHAMFPIHWFWRRHAIFLPTVRDMSCNISFQLVFKTPCNVSFHLFLRCHAIFPSNWSLRRHPMFPSNCSWDVMNISFQLVLKMSCNLFFLSWRYAVSFPYCADSSKCLFSFWYWFHANIHYMFNFWSFGCHISNIFKLISMSQSRKSVRYSYTNAHCIIHMV